MKIDEVMIPCPYKVPASTTISEALEIMALREIRHLPVIEEETLVGVVSERELMLAESASDGKAATHPVSSISMSDPYLVPQGAPVAQVAYEMSENKLDCALIIDGDGTLVGIFTSTDACRLLHMVLEEK